MKSLLKDARLWYNSLIINISMVEYNNKNILIIWFLKNTLHNYLILEFIILYKLIFTKTKYLKCLDYWEANL